MNHNGGRRGIQPAASNLHHSLVRAARAARQLSVLSEVLADEIGRRMVELLEMLAGPDQPTTPVDAAAVRSAYGQLFALLADEAELSSSPLVGDAWQNHLLDRVLADENAFSRKLARASLPRVGSSLLAQVRQDLRRLRALFLVSGCDLAHALEERFGQDEDGEPWVAWDELRPLLDGRFGQGEAVLTLKRHLAGLADWAQAVEALATHYAAGGAGLFGRYRAFRWVGSGPRAATDGHPSTLHGLQGIATPDPIRLEELIGYEAERELLVRNTEWFLDGLPANNVLVYGERGTGKSSTIKALLNAYAERGLRMVEVSKHDLEDFPSILALLRDRHERFILFVDDLSFEHNETYYKELKAVLEGGLEARPSNVLLYATSNRRHLVQERWSDREGFDHEEVHSRDALQEKLSLADRFGISLTFLAPDQERYLAIVHGLAQRRDLEISPEQLRARAIQWAQLHNARSGRTARQFIDYLTAELRSSSQKVEGRRLPR